MIRDYEKLGMFYLGKEYDLASRERKDGMVLYDSKDLTTHAVIIGMTGSGKTGLGIGIIEEALIDGIPVIAIDPKGDLPNLLLTFPDLKPEDFNPWINPQDAINQGLTHAQYAKAQAALWKKGLQEWDQESDRIGRLQAAADFAVYTPGSKAGLPVSVLRSFNPPPPPLREDEDLFRDRIQTTTTSILALIGIEGDPITSREHILIANIFENVWHQGQSLDLAGLIQAIQSPPFERIGVMGLDLFFPPRERFSLAMRINNLLAAPGFEAWLDGMPMDIERLFYTPSGKPRASIFTISHLSAQERMFFVAILLNEVLGWARSQQGTTSLRALLYMDEIFGYFPPVSEPPSKKPLLTLLKQARAYGLGVVLSTQNPVDLDYKGLSNTGTWFIGRLQTERDKERVLSGLEGAAIGEGFNRREMEETLAALGKRVFLLHNVHENQPVVFQTRWVLSYLRGPLTRDQIKKLMANKIASAQKTITSSRTGQVTGVNNTTQKSDTSSSPPSIPPGIPTFFVSASGTGQTLEYHPAVLCRLDVHYSNARYHIEQTVTMAFAALLNDGPIPFDWDEAEVYDPSTLVKTALPNATFSALPAVAEQESFYRKSNKDLIRWVRLNKSMSIYRSRQLKMSSDAGESEGAFRARITQALREKRDLEVASIRKKYNAKVASLNDRLLRAQQAVAREDDQADNVKFQTAISFGSAIIGAFLGRKVVSKTSVSKVGTAMKSAGRMQKERMDVERAQERLTVVRQQLEEVETNLHDDITKIEASFDPENEILEETTIKAKSTDISVNLFGLAWMPFRVSQDGRLTADWKQ